VSAENTDDELSFPAGIDHVIVRDSTNGRGVQHRPHPDDADLPACNRATRSGTDYLRKTHPRHVIFRDRCRGCPWPDDRQGSWTCLDCPREFNTLDGLRQHQQQDCPQPEVRRG
jgi:hypothetical protein